MTVRSSNSKRQIRLGGLAVLVCALLATLATAHAADGSVGDTDSLELLRNSLHDARLTHSLNGLSAVSRAVEQTGTQGAVVPCPNCDEGGAYASDWAARPERGTVRLNLNLGLPPSMVDPTEPVARRLRRESNQTQVAPPRSDLTMHDMGRRVWEMGMHARGLSHEALRRTVTFINSNYLRIRNQRFVTIIDYSQPSSSHRMYVFDLMNGSIERHPVSHGSGSGNMTWASGFTDRPNSNATSTGAFLTASSTSTSQRVGFRLVLEGAERTNQNALQRGIVMHGAWYATEEFLRTYGRVGRSQGCPAMDPQTARRLLPQLAGGSVVYHYGV